MHWMPQTAAQTCADGVEVHHPNRFISHGRINEGTVRHRGRVQTDKAPDFGGIIAQGWVASVHAQVWCVSLRREGMRSGAISDCGGGRGWA